MFKSLETLNLYETALEVWEIIGFVASFIRPIYSNIYDNCHSFITRLCKKGHANLAESNTNRNQSIPQLSARKFSFLIAFNALELAESTPRPQGNISALGVAAG